jgi:acyl carrier protein
MSWTSSEDGAVRTWASGSRFLAERREGSAGVLLSGTMTGTVGVIKHTVAKIKADPGLLEQLSDTADLVDEVGLDSLEMLQFMLEIERSLPVVIDFETLEFSHLRSITTLAAFLDSMPTRPPAVTA